MRVVKLDNFTKSQKPWEAEEVEWREVRLGEVCIINPKKSEVRHLLDQNIEVSFIPMDYVDDNEGKIVRQEIKPIGAVYKGYTYFKEGDVLFAKITPCMENGKSAVARNFKNGIGFGSTEFHVLRPTENILPEFIFYFIRRKRFRNLAKLHFTGTVGHKRVPKEFLINAKIPLPFRNGKPDLETQKKIVEYIEANFSRIDKILEKKKKELEKLEELWESVLEETFKPKEGEEWREMRLEKVAKDIKSGGTPARKNKEYWENGTVPWVKIQDIPDDGYINDTEEKITEKGLNNSSAKLLPKGTLLFTIFATIGRVGILNIEAATNQAIAGIIPKEDYDQKYLYWVLRKFGEKLEYRGRGGAQNNVNLTFLKNLKIPIPFRNNQPDLEKQKEIANYLDSVYEKIKTLKEKIQNQIALLEEMKESILGEVFSHDKETNH